MAKRPSTALIERLRKQLDACNADRLALSERNGGLDRQLGQAWLDGKILHTSHREALRQLDEARTLLAQWLTRYDATTAAQLAAKTREALAPPVNAEAPR